MNEIHYLTRGIALLLTGLSLVIAVTLTAPQTTRADPGVLCAAPSAVGSGNCSSWANACTLQTALANALSGDEIWVKKGVHYPGTSRADAFTLKNDVAIYGGFAGTETQRNQRNWQTNKTVLSGDIDRNDLTDPNGVVTTTVNIRGSNAYHVVTAPSGTNDTAVLDGFVVTAGQANVDAWSYYCGAGMYTSGSNPRLTNVTFSGNYAGRGGGMYNDGSNPTLTNVTFSGNNASFGGGIYNDGNNPTLTSVTFSDNYAVSGGGMYNDGSSPMLTDITFSGNHAGEGSGMYNYHSSPTLTSVTFSGNTASSSGGGMYNDGSSPTLTNVTFSGNSARTGGGMHNDSSNPTLMNVTFSGNSANYGGGMYNHGSSPMLTNVTFNDNSADYYGGGMYNSNNSSPTLTNVTFSGNSARTGGGMHNDSSSPTLTNLTFSGNSARTGGGMYNSSSSPTLTNLTFSGNSAAYYGGGMYNNTSSPTLKNVTFSGNGASYKGGGMYNASSSPALRNVIMWGDTATSERELYNSPNPPSIAYSDIQGCGGSGGGWNSACGTDSGHNIDADPRFVDADGPDNTPGTADDNLRLQLTSPCIDAGNNAVVPSEVTTDLDGNPRFMDIPSVPNTGNGTPPIVDMGAYEARPSWGVYLPLVLRNH